MDWNNKQMVLEAVKQRGRVLQFASDKLKNNKDCPPIAIEDNTVPKNDNNVPATNSTSPKFLFFKTDFCLMYK